MLLRAVIFCWFCLLLVNPGGLYAQAPVVFEGGVANGASFRPSNAQGGAVAQGSIISIFGSNLSTGIATSVPVPLPINLLGTSVTIGGQAAALFFVSAGQINAQVPWGAPTGTVQLTVQTPGGTSAPVNVSVVDTAPGLFSQAASGRGPGAVLNFVSQGNTPTNTAASTISPNGIVLIFATGLGPVAGPPADGAAGAGQPTTTTPVVTIGGRQAVVEFSGLAPGFVSLYQINARVPPDTPEGCYLPLQVAFGNQSSNTVTIGVTNTGGDCNEAGSGSPGFFFNGSFGVASVNRFTTQLPVPLPGFDLPDTFSASFRRFEAVIPTADAGFPPVGGGCNVAVYRFDSNNPPDILNFISQDQPLDAGTLTLSGPFAGSPQVIGPSQPGEYSMDLGIDALAPGTWTLAGSGGADVGAFNTMVEVLSPLFSVTNFGVQGTSFSQSQPLTINWSCPDPNGTVGVFMASANAADSLFGVVMCSASCSDGQVTIGSDLLGQLPVSSEAAAFVTANFFSDLQSGRIEASGLDFGLFGYNVGESLFGVTLTQ